MFATDRQAGNPGHPQEHNALARALNYRIYASQYASVQAAIDAAIATRCPLELEPGATYALDAPLRIENATGLVVNGNGANLQATVDLPVLLDINGAAGCVFRNLSLSTLGYSQGTIAVTDMLHLRWDSVVTRSTTRNLFEHVHISGRYVNGVRIGTWGGTVQEDNSLWQMVTVSGWWQPGENTLWQRGFIVGTGLHANNMLHNFISCTTYRHRIQYEVAACRYVSLNVCNASISEIDVWSNATRAVAMNMYRSEGGAMLFKGDAGGAGYPMLMAIRDCGFHPHDGIGSTLNADGHWVEVNYGGSLLMENIAVQPVPDGQWATVYGRNLQRPLYIRAHGLSIEGTPAAAMIDVTGATVDQFGCFEIADSGRMV